MANSGMIKISVNTEAINEALSKITGDTAPLMASIAEVLVSSADQSFEDERDPVTGLPWVPLSEAYAAKKSEQGYSNKILEKSGTLKLIQSNSSATEAEAGSPMIYSAVHNLGYEKGGIPQRRFLGIDDIAEEEILDAINQHYQSAFE